MVPRNPLRIAKLFLFTFGAVLTTVALHELGHSLVGGLLGNDMTMDLNGSRPVDGRYNAPWHLPVVAIAGPVVTLGQSVGGAVLMRRTGDTRLYPLVLFPFLYRIVPYLLGLAQPSRLGLQDEAIVAAFLGINLLLIAGCVILPLAALAWYGTREGDVSPGKAVGTGVLSIAFAALLIGLT